MCNRIGQKPHSLGELEMGREIFSEPARARAWGGEEKQILETAAIRI